MTDGKSNPGKGDVPGGPGKRPYATLDLKATEVKIAPDANASDAGTSHGSASGGLTPDSDVPLPASASSYAATSETREQPKAGARMQSESDRYEKAKASTSSAGSSAPSGHSTANPSDTKVIVERRGGFFTHLVAGIVGGALSFLVLQWAVPELGLDGTVASRFTNNTASLTERIGTLEKKISKSARATDLEGAENRITSLEKTSKTIPALTDSQRRLVAETKAALASAASDVGSTVIIDRVSKVEDKLKAMADAGANDPNPSRIEQLAGLTAKVTDLESSLSTQLAALRADVTKDVESKVQTDAARIETSVNANKEATAHVAADLKSAQDQTAELKTAIDTFKTEAAKPAQIAAAVAPIADKTAALEKSVAQVVQSESQRQKIANQVVLALELQNLKRALDSGEKFSAQLAEVKKLAAGNVDLRPLTKLQDTGVPTLTDLKKEFRSAANAAMDAESASRSSGVVDRLWAEAKSVVRVRRIDANPDDKSTEATLGRMQVALNDGRLSDTLEASQDLSPTAQDAARPFLDKLAARVSVDRSLAQLESQLKSSIAPGSAPAAKSAP